MTKLQTFYHDRLPIFQR